MPTYIVSLDTGRFGDVVVVEADDEESARRALTRTQRRKAQSIRQFIPTSQRRAEALSRGLSFPEPISTRGR